MAQPIFPPGDATRPKDRERSHGAETGSAFVLDVAQGMGLRATRKLRFGTPLSSEPVTSPVLVAAGATNSNPISNLVVYVDGVQQYSIECYSHFDTKIAMPSGLHHWTVKAWDTAGQVFSATEDVTVK